MAWNKRKKKTNSLLNNIAKERLTGETNTSDNEDISRKLHRRRRDCILLMFCVQSRKSH